MSNRMNHANINMRKRIASEGRWETSSNEFWPGSIHPKRFKWRAVYLKKHKGKTLPEILAFDPGYVIGFLYMMNVLFAPLLSRTPTGYQMAIAHQLEVLANRAQHIRLPRKLRKTHQFVIVADANGVFESVLVISKNAEPKDLEEGSRVVDRRKELDLSIPYHFKNEALGMKRMGECFREIFFKSEMLKPTADQCQMFFFDKRNFNLQSCTSHTSWDVTLEDHEALKYRLQTGLQ